MQFLHFISSCEIESTASVLERKERRSEKLIASEKTRYGIGMF